MSGLYRLFILLLCSSLITGCSTKSKEDAPKSEAQAPFELSELPERESLDFPRSKQPPLLFVNASEDAPGLYALEGEGDEATVRLIDPDFAFEPMIAQVLYEQIGRTKDLRVGIRGLLYTSENAHPWTPPPLEDDEASKTDAETPPAAAVASATEPQAEEVATAKPDGPAQLGTFGGQRMLRLEPQKNVQDATTVSTLDQSVRALRRVTGFSVFDLKEIEKTTLVRRSEPAHAVRATMGPDDAPIVFPSGYVIAAATTETLETKGWFFVGGEGLLVLNDAMEAVGVVHAANTLAPMRDVTSASFISRLEAGGMLVALKREGTPSELYYLSALQPYSPETPPTDDLGEGEEAAPAAAESDAEPHGQDGNSSAVVPEFLSVAYRLKNEEDQPLAISFLGGGGLGLPSPQNHVVKGDALYFAYGPGTVSSQWTRVFRADAQGWTVFDHKVAAGFHAEEAVWGAVRSALSPFLFDAGERGLFLALGESGVFLNVSAAKGSDWTLSPVETRLPKLKTSATTVAANGWVYLNGSHRARMRAPSKNYAIAFNLESGEAHVLDESMWLGVVSDGRYASAFHPERLRVRAVIGQDSLRRIFAIDAENPGEGRVILGELGENVKEARFFGVSIGPRRLLQLLREDGRVQLAVIDVRTAHSLRLIHDREAVDWTRIVQGDEQLVPAKATRPLNGF